MRRGRMGGRSAPATRKWPFVACSTRAGTGTPLAAYKPSRVGPRQTVKRPSRCRRTVTRAPAHVGTTGLLGQLQAHGVEAHGVVGGDGSLILLTQDLIEIDVAERHEGRRRIGRRVAEAGVVVGNEALAKIRVGGLERGDVGQA